MPSPSMEEAEAAELAAAGSRGVAAGGVGGGAEPLMEEAPTTNSRRNSHNGLFARSPDAAAAAAAAAGFASLKVPTLPDTPGDGSPGPLATAAAVAGVGAAAAGSVGVGAAGGRLDAVPGEGGGGDDRASKGFFARLFGAKAFGGAGGGAGSAGGEGDPGLYRPPSHNLPTLAQLDEESAAAVAAAAAATERRLHAMYHAAQGPTYGDEKIGPVDNIQLQREMRRRAMLEAMKNSAWVSFKKDGQQQ
ncbi:hypothetical protein GPECTOR_31g345 [Gonium pectorale]|uniref:Uncharacterized protein n=1 Tax=Gonium pectorale TaxID=33097 RepID=A0A150GDY2_GONPE|nr:hypothetical protein GPECTOR_31g345 [Gonium pectorale]|eukprot:KXZ47983.1 hypothetical protein GPECTOR_31g345 [Gonium pectorale]